MLSNTHARSASAVVRTATSNADGVDVRTLPVVKHGK
jgi:hypothetical protein